MGNVVLSLCDTELSALKSEIYTLSLGDIYAHREEEKKRLVVWTMTCFWKELNVICVVFTFALRFISRIKTVPFRFIFRAFEVRETCCDEWKWDTGVSFYPVCESESVCVFCFGQTGNPN